MLKVTDLSKEYPTARGPLRVLSGVSFELVPGDAAAIMGPSGSGKSSLLYILGGLEPPTSGRVTLDDVDPFALAATELAAFRNARIGFVFQDHCLLPQCTVLENVMIPTLVAPAKDASRGSARTKADDLARARQLVERVGLADRSDHRPAQLSGGERQRVAIARALVRDPRILVFDEATSNLDSHSERLIQDALDGIARGRTTLVIAHRLSTIVDSDTIFVLDHGRIAESGTHEELLRKDGLYAKLWAIQSGAEEQNGAQEERELTAVAAA